MNVFLITEEQYKEEEKLLLDFQQAAQSVEPRNYITFCQSGMVFY
jgi:hypothetical protein